jgi:pimeloyl-ACP methyl ester carboxylesterase
MAAARVVWIWSVRLARAWRRVPGSSGHGRPRRPGRGDDHRARNAGTTDRSQIVLPGVDHVAHLEHQAEFADALQSFIERRT